MTIMSGISAANKAALRYAAGAPRGRTIVRLGTSAQGIPLSTWTPISWVIADEDDLSAWSSSVNPTRITTPPRMTHVRFEFFCVWQSSGFSNRYMRLSKNGDTTPEVQAIRHPASEALTCAVSRMRPTVPGDYFQLYCLSGSGGDFLGGTANNHGPTWLMAEWFSDTAPGPGGYMLTEDGGYVLLEDGVSKLKLEDET